LSSITITVEKVRQTIKPKTKKTLMSFFAPTAHMQSLHLPTFSLIYCIVSPLGDTETFEKKSTTTI